MFSRNKTPDEEYEMVEPRPQSSSNDSVSTPDESRNSNETDTSEIFNTLEQYSIKLNDNFNSDPHYQTIYDRYRNKTNNLKLWGIFFLSILILWVTSVLIYAKMTPKDIISILQTEVKINGENITLNTYNPNFNNLSLHSMVKGEYQLKLDQITWLEEKQYPKGAQAGGYYLINDEKKYKIKQIDHEYDEIFLDNIRFNYRNDFFNIESIVLNPSSSIEELNTKHLVITDSIQQWRHSKFSLYWLYNPITSTYEPIQPPKNRDLLNSAHPFQDQVLDKLHFAEFSPNGNYIVFGFEHNLFMLDVKSKKINQITNDGSSDIFNGKPDWVYEEEVMPVDKMVWWSPDEKYIIFTKINDTQVESIDIDYYIKSHDAIGAQYQQSTETKYDNVNQYPIKTSIKYPKPGSTNPKISIYSYDIEQKTLQELNDPNNSLGDDFILYQGTWIDDNNFLMKQTDRTSSILSKKLYQPGKEVQTIKSTNVTKDYNGWVEKMKPICTLSDGSYIDIVVKDYKNQLAFYKTASSKDPITILASDILTGATYNRKRDFIYFLSNAGKSMESNLVGLNLSNNELINITNDAGYYEMRTSKDGQFFNLIYEGSSLPWQKLIDISKFHDYLNSNDQENINDFVKNVPHTTADKGLTSKLKNLNLPTVTFEEVRLKKDKISNNIKQILPPNFDPSKKYPLLVHAYGGPGSQTVQQKFQIDFLNCVSAGLNSIVLVIEPRGTGGKDWKYLSFSNNNIGYWEPRDITLITSEYITKNKFISKDNVALWGWSYGGFTTLKTLEYDEGKTFKYGMAVAPVTNWLFYDSIYTERYMNLPKFNSHYKNAKINNYESFKSIKRFLIMSGSADDNVNPQNTMWLINKFNQHNVENYDMMIFPDSNHAITFQNDNIIVYDKLYNWLGNAFNGKFNGLL